MTTFDVKTYGAVGNGTTDDTSSIQNAINAAIANGGGTVYFPQGDYKTTSTLTLTSLEGVSLKGDNWNSAKIRSAANGDTVRVESGAGFELKNLGFHPLINKTSGAEINLKQGFSFVINGVNIFDSGPSSQPNVGIALNNYGTQFKYWIENTEVNGCREQAIVIGKSGGGLVQDVWLRNIIVARSGAEGLLMVNCSGIDCVNLESLNDTQGVATYPGNGQIVKSVKMTNAIFDTGSDSGFKMLTGGGSVYDCQFSNCWFSGNSNHGLWVAQGTGKIDGIIFTGSQFLNNKKHGAFVESGSGFQFVSCQFKWNSMTNNNQYYGLSIWDDVDDVVINSNLSGAYGEFAAQNAQRGGYRIGANCDRVVFTSNIAKGNASVPWDIYSTVLQNSNAS
ncbi:glycosyl hydrolase family 28-related protein [Maritalea sp.]|uniref:glycosyl hydrolase family 28-related protein n=1 Tax=Maritalea sp. TaxID=2003361 RepID=UPI003EFAE801